MKLGLFGLNSNSGIAMTEVPERWQAKWDDIRAVAELADTNNFDFILPLCRWRGYGGKTNPADKSYETFTFAASLASITKKIHLYATVHVPFIHPTIAARSSVAINEISSGRFGVNIVCGWSQNEFEMFGIKDTDFKHRYAQGYEWAESFNQMLSGKPFGSYNGEFYNIKNAECPNISSAHRMPLLMSAAFSPEGRIFATNTCDTLITMYSNLNSAKTQIKNIKENAKKIGRKLEVYTIAHIVCRDTDLQAQQYYDYYADEKADDAAVSNFISNMGSSSPIVSKMLAERRKTIAGGAGSAAIIGSPTSVANAINDIAKIGFDGLAIAFVNYRTELPPFIDQVAPFFNFVHYDNADIK